MTPFSQQLKSWRLHRGLTQAQLAHQAGVSRPNLVFLEQGRRDCTITTLRRLAAALAIGMGQLLEEPPPETVRRELDRHQIDRVARSLLGGDTVEASLRPIARATAAEAAPLLRAVGIKVRGSLRKRTDPSTKRLLAPILKRVHKLAAARLSGVNL